MKFESENGYIIISESDVDENELVIDNVVAFKKRKGTGTMLVNMAIEYAKKENKKLSLCAYPQDDSIELYDLVEFYKGLGFVVEYDDGSEVIMSR